MSNSSRKKRISQDVDDADVVENVENIEGIDKKRRIEFAKNLQDLIIENNYTGLSFSTELEVSNGTISSYLNGKTTPDLDLLCVMADKLGVSIEYLSGRSKTRKYEYDDINKSLGLTEEAIKMLYIFNQANYEDKIKNEKYKNYLKIINLLFENGIDLMILIENIDKYIIDKTTLFLCEHRSKNMSLEEKFHNEKELINELIAKDKIILSQMKMQQALSNIVDKITEKYNKYKIQQAEIKDYIGGDEQ